MTRVAVNWFLSCVHQTAWSSGTACGLRPQGGAE